MLVRLRRFLRFPLLPLALIGMTMVARPAAAATYPTVVGMAAAPGGTGYWLVSADGGIDAFGTAQFYGSMGGHPLARPIVGMAATPSGHGYWEVASDGGLFSWGDARFYGSMGGHPLVQPIVGIAATPDSGGYWEVASDGGIFAFGDARFYGSMGGHPLTRPIVGIAGTSTGRGYWEVASDGGIFAFGDARFYGSMGGHPLTRPIVGIAGTPSGHGYWEVASDGGVFSWGDASFHGSMGGHPLNQPVTGMASSPSGSGYWQVATDGGIFAFGDAAFSGSPVAPAPGVGGLVPDAASPVALPAGWPGARSVWPGAGNTGVPAGVALHAPVGNDPRYQLQGGSVTVTQNGAVIDSLDIQGQLVIAANNVTVQNTRVRDGNDSWEVYIQPSVSGPAIIRDSEIDGLGGAGCAVGVGYRDFLLLRDNIHDCGDGVHPNYTAVVQDTWIHSLNGAAGTHNDGIQITDGNAVFLYHNTVIDQQDQTSATQIGADLGPISNVVEEDNLVAGGDYAIYGGSGGSYPVTNIKILNNRVLRTPEPGAVFANGGYYGPVWAIDDPQITFLGNVWDNTGTLVS